jgi:hypothetical protein
LRSLAATDTGAAIFAVLVLRSLGPQKITAFSVGLR